MTASGPGPRLLRVRCTRWDQVESFLRKKLRADGRLSMKVPFDAQPGVPVTLTLELPNQIVIALDGAVARAEANERADATVVQLAGAKYAIDRLEAMLADARAGGEGGNLAATLSVREAELRRLRQQAAHDVLGVSRTPTLEELRRAWRLRARREHPDAVARFGSAALRLTAEEAMIHVTRAYERLRDTVCADKRAVIAGTSVRTVGSLALEVAPSDAFEVEPLTPSVADTVEVREPPPRRTTAPMRAMTPPPRTTTPTPPRTITPMAPAAATAPRRTTAPMPAVTPPAPSAAAPARTTTPAPLPPPPVELPQLLDNDADTLDGLDRPISQPLALDLDLPPATYPRIARQAAPSIRGSSVPGTTPNTTLPGTAAPRGSVAAAAAEARVSLGTAATPRTSMPALPLPAPSETGKQGPPLAPTTVEQSLRQARSGPGDRFVRAVHDRLALADHAGAAQVAAAAHQVYPQDLRLRALIDIATAQAACARGDRRAALAALQAAIAADPEGTEARSALVAVTGANSVDASLIQDRFR